MTKTVGINNIDAQLLWKAQCNFRINSYHCKMSNCQFNPTPPYQIYFLKNELQDIQKICTKSEYSEYLQVYVFGSRLKKDCYNPDSDLDLMVKNINIDTRLRNDGYQHYMCRGSLEKECNQVTFIKLGWSCIENIKPEVQKSVQ